MAILFDALTSKLQHDTAALDSTTWTFCVWLYALGLGEGSFGEIFVWDETGNDVYEIYHDSVANRLEISARWNVTLGQWEVSTVTDNQWNAVAISYDGGSTANDPLARVNFAAATVTEVGTPTGTLPAAAPGYCVGNKSTQDFTWDGRLQHLQYFNVILTADEMDAALRRPGSIRRGLRLWLPMFHASYVADLSGNAFHGTGTALATTDSAPCQPPWAAAGGWRGAFTAAAGAATSTPGWRPTTSRR